jgi:hypothetical protein
MPRRPVVPGLAIVPERSIDAERGIMPEPPRAESWRCLVRDVSVLFG